MNESELSIVEHIRRGDTRKYALLVDRYKERGLALATRIVRSRQEAEEVLQDAFLRAFRRIDTFRGESSFGTWFYRILYNLCLTRVRRGVSPRDPSSSLNDDSSDAIGVVDESSDAFLALEERDMRELLHAELDRLPERYRIPLTLFYLQELSYEEIASVMRVPIGTVKTNLHRARFRLRARVLEVLSVEDLVS